MEIPTSKPTLIPMCKISIEVLKMLTQIDSYYIIGRRRTSVLIATLSTCTQLERDNISFRLLSGRKRHIEKGGKLGRKVGSVKTAEQVKAEYREVISLLRKGYSIRDVAKLCGKGISTVQRVKSRLNL